MSGKGSKARPLSVSKDTFGNNFDKIFRKPTPRELDDELAEKEAFDLINTRNQFDRDVIMKNEYYDEDSTDRT
jgi:hypothetical protein